ncbi:MAG: NAD(P)H-dependent oxidoreductase [Pseudonocardia sp.]|nr:NAD(P)H-dependent oxidoreductase [Pseudonocardia sp.]
MKFLRVDSSIRQQGSVSRAVAGTVEQGWLDQHPGSEVVRRDLGAEPLPFDAWGLSMAAGAVPEGDRAPEIREAHALAARLADELIEADAVAVGMPLYNFGVPAQIKNWIDLVITDPRFGPGATPLAGKPVTLVVARGGGYAEGTPREGWDHATPYLQRIFSDYWSADVAVVVAELTLAEVNPAMAELRPLAAESLARAHERAIETAREHGAKLAAVS